MHRHGSAKPRTRKLRHQLGHKPVVHGPAHWQDDHRSKLNNVLQRLLGRPSRREDIVFEVCTATDVAMLVCSTIRPPRYVTASIQEHVAEWRSGPGNKEDGREPTVLPEMETLLELLEADFALPPTSSADEHDRRLSVQNMLRKSLEKRLSHMLLLELVAEGYVLESPVATNVSNAYVLGPSFAGPPPNVAAQDLHQGSEAAARAQVAETLVAVLGSADRTHGSMRVTLFEALRALLGRNARKGDVVFRLQEAPPEPPRLSLQMPPLNFATECELEAVDPASRRAAENRLCATTLEHFLVLLERAPTQVPRTRGWPPRNTSSLLPRASPAPPWGLQQPSIQVPALQPRPPLQQLLPEGVLQQQLRPPLQQIRPERAVAGWLASAAPTPQGVPKSQKPWNTTVLLDFLAAKRQRTA